MSGEHGQNVGKFMSNLAFWTKTCHRLFGTQVTPSKIYHPQLHSLSSEDDCEIADENLS